MKEVFSFYRAVDPMKGSWDGYGYFPMLEQDFLAFVTDAPSGASIHTPELIKDFWKTFSENTESRELPVVELTDALNRLQNDLQQKGRRENTLYQATITIAWKSGANLFYCCVGDSSLHILRGGKLYQLSESEVWDGALITTQNRARQERQKTGELRFIGSNGTFIESAAIHTLDLKNEDVLIFNTDGVEDLMAPDALLKLVTTDGIDAVHSMRERLETIFAPERVKDDATLLMVPVRVGAVFEAQKEFAILRTQLEKLQKEQKEMRTQLSDFAQTRGRLERIESTLNQVSQDLKRTKRSQPVFHNTIPSAGSGVSAKRNQRLPWLIALVALIAATGAGAFLFKGRDVPAPQETVQQKRPVTRRTVAPPEIPSVIDCSYTVQKGDTLDKIATAQSITVEQLLAWNPSQTKEAPLRIGQKLIVCKEAP